MKKVIKGLLGLACVAAMSASFVACGGKEKPPTGGGENPPPVEQKKDPAVVGEARGYYFEELPGDMTFNMRMNGGTFQSVKADGTELTRNNEYKFNIGTEVLTLNNSWLETLSEGNHTVTFTTTLGSCDITVTIGEKGLANGYNLQIAKDENDLNDNFYVKAGRTDAAVKFDFLTFGDFGKEGAGLEFINVLIDNSPFDDTGLNWRLGAEDINVRVYSDGSVVYRTFTGTEEKNGVQNGMDNIWWRINRTKPNYKTEGINDVTISREGGVTRFTLEITYDLLKIEAEDDIRFALMECSDTSQNDFNLYDRGLLKLDGVEFEDPYRLSHWPMLDSEGNVVRPEDIVVIEPEVPQGYDLAFANEKDRMHAKVSLASDGSGVQFDFWTGGDFGVNGVGRQEFLNIYLDTPAFNKNGKNWCFEEEDINVRVYSDGTVYKKTGFNGSTADNVWYPRTQLSDDNVLAQKATITKSKQDGTTISVVLTYEDLGTTKSDFKGVRFWLAECTDSDANFDYAGADFTINGEKAGVDALLTTWPMFTAEGEVVFAKDIVAEGVPEGYDISFAADRDGFYSKVSYDSAKGVTFDFWTDGDFGINVDNDVEYPEFVQIYLDMPAFNVENRGNWRFESEDIIIRIYSTGEVYFLKNFDGTGDNIWVKLNRGENPTVNKRNENNTPPIATKADNIVITRMNGKTAFSLTVSLADLGVAEGSLIDSFRFYIAECAENGGGDFNFYGSTMNYKGTALGDAVTCNNFAKFTLGTGKVSLPGDDAPDGYNLTFGATHDKFYSKISYDSAKGVTFDFWTERDFGKEGENLEFVQIYLDMPAFNAYTGANWKFNSNEDIIIRIYSNGNVYLIKQFEDRADNIWIKLDHNTTAAYKTIAINKANPVTSFSLTLSLEELGIAEGGTLESFRFLMAECADGGNDFQLYDGADLTYNGKTVDGAHSCDNWATYKLATNEITLP